MNKFIIAITVIGLLLPTSLLAQRNRDRGGMQSPEKMRQRIEDLRKVKLLDLLDLQGDQVERFFAVYNDYNGRIESVRAKIEATSKELQSAISSDASESEIKRLTKELRSQLKEATALFDKRFDEVQPILTTSQFAQYIVFEARFRDELQRMIMDRMRKMRK